MLTALKGIDPETSSNIDRLSSYMIQGDPVCKEDDTYYYDSRQIAEHLNTTNRRLRSSCRKHVLLLCLQFCLLLGFLLVFQIGVQHCVLEVNWNSTSCEVNRNMRTQKGEVNPIFVYLLVPLILGIILSSAMLLYICRKRRQRGPNHPSITNIYQFSNLLFVEHAIILLAYELVLLLGISIVVHFGVNPDVPGAGVEMIIVALCICVPCVMLVIHGIVGVVSYRSPQCIFSTRMHGAKVFRISLIATGSCFLIILVSMILIVIIAVYTSD